MSCKMGHPNLNTWPAFFFDLRKSVSISIYKVACLNHNGTLLTICLIIEYGEIRIFRANTWELCDGGRGPSVLLANAAMNYKRREPWCLTS